MIKAIVNGYFRSGTTFLWDSIVESFPKAKVFYEPLHSHLAGYIREELAEGKRGLHGKILWKEYSDIPEEKLKELMLNHPNPGGNELFSEKDVVEYLNIFDNLAEDSILQPNRANFFLDSISKKFENAKIIHVIRHPLDVWLSVEKAYMKQEASKKQQLIRKLLYPILRKNAFSLKQQYNWIAHRLGYPFFHERNWRLKYFQINIHWEMFAVVWVISNYFALKAIEKNNGIYVTYEDMTANPRKASAEIGEYIGNKNFNLKKPMRNNSFKFTAKQILKFETAIKKMNLEKEYMYILQKVQERGIKY